MPSRNICRIENLDTSREFSDYETGAPKGRLMRKKSVLAFALAGTAMDVSVSVAAPAPAQQCSAQIDIGSWGPGGTPRGADARGVSAEIAGIFAAALKAARNPVSIDVVAFSGGSRMATCHVGAPGDAIGASIGGGSPDLHHEQVGTAPFRRVGGPKALVVRSEPDSVSDSRTAPIRYDNLQIVLHWTTVVLVVALYALAQVWEFFGKPTADQLVDVHIYLGMLLAGVVFVRIFWH